jgi:hypothetical protein
MTRFIDVFNLGEERSTARDPDRGRHAPPEPGACIEVLEDAAKACPACRGSGAQPLSDNLNWLPCWSCGGTGRQRLPFQGGAL